ncbi:DUF4197 domain-containing protein [Owenweeksia hongkongensis]|uniref:DUF4197 domain-containing protein n=1 Tax=Owenweeksia hongkongensis TaxID=253245 RepID=UPI003A8F6AEB
MRLVLSTLLAFCLLSCDQLNTLVENAGSTLPPTESEISNGIREALIVGAKNAINETSKKNGFLNNSLIKIPFPAEAQKVEKAARDLGLDAQVDQFIETMNHGAEQASAKATDIFISSIKQMTLQDVYDIWRGDNDAATQYLIRTTSDRLRSEFRPIIKQSLDKVQVTKYWSPLVDNYNKIPFVTKVNPDLDEYVLDETLEGLFVIIAQEEASIRENPQARVSAILQKVFGYNGGNF